MTVHQKMENGVSGLFLGDSFNSERVLELVQTSSSTELRKIFDKIRVDNDHRDVKKGFRSFSARLLEKNIISIADYVGVFGGTAKYHLSQREDGTFIDLNNSQDASLIARKYSLAKYGSIEDIRFFSKVIIQEICREIEDTNSCWFQMFEEAKSNQDNVVLMTTGWRNVPSTANVMFEIALEHINIKLAYLGYPTIVNVKLPRIAPPCENYASLSTEERERVSAVQDHVIPDRNFYRGSGIHVIFGDDALVTGSTADKVFFESMQNGAKSFKAFYPVVIDPVAAFKDPSIEERLNMTQISGELDDVMATLLSHSKYVPILRSLRLLLSQHNYANLTDFLEKIPTDNLLKLYSSALANEFMMQDKCKKSLVLVKNYLVDNGCLNENGLMMLP